MGKPKNAFTCKKDCAIKSLKEVNCFLNKIVKSYKTIQFAKSLKK